MTRTITGLCIYLLTAVLALASEPARLAIPHLVAPPTLDGALAPGEWDGATRVSGMIDQFSGQAASRQASFWIGYDKENLCVAQRSTVQPREWSPQTPPIWFDKGDSSFVIGLAPGRINRGDEPSHYLLRVNLHGQTIAQEIARKIKGVRLSFPHPAWQVKPEIKHAFNAEKTEWTSELAIPLASMKVAAVQDGETWGVWFARDYEAADQTAVQRSSDWKFGDGRRHYGRAFYNNYRLEEEWTRATMGSQTRESSERESAGSRTRESPEGPEVSRLLLREGDGVADFSFLGYQKGGGLLVSTAELQRYGVYTGAGEAELTATSYDPITNDFYARLGIGSLPEVHKVVRGEIVIRQAGETSPIVTHALPDFRAEVTLGMHSTHLGVPRSTVLEWFAPADGAVDVAYECCQNNAHPNDGVGFQLVHFDAAARQNRVLVPRQQLTHDKGWVPYAAQGLAVRRGDRVQLGYDKWGGEGNDDGRLRGRITLTTADGRATEYWPAGEFAAKQGGTSGVWFYRYDDDVTPNPDGNYPELKWQGHPWGFSGWLWFDGNDKKLEPWQGNPDHNSGRAWATIRSYRENAERKVRFHLPDLSPGVYQATVGVYDPRGALLGQARQNFIRFDHAKDLPWLGNTLGITDKVLPPWTPLATTPKPGAGLDLACWGRTYHIAGNGLFAALDVQAQSGLDQATKDILAGPVRVEIVQGGQPMSLTPSGLTEVKTAAHEASYRGELAGAGWHVTTRGRMEYDGYVEHRITLAADGKQGADRIRLVIPLKPDEATHLHATAGDWFRSSVSSIALPAGAGVLWHSGQSHGLGVKPHTENRGRRMTVGDFKPYVWIGGPNRGLAFMADNDQGWVPDDEKKVHAIEVVREGDRVNLILNLVARPFTFDKPREIVFSLQATPVRPLLPDFRDKLERLHLTTAFPGGDPDGWCWNGCMFWVDGQHLVGGHGSQPYPLNWDRNIAKRKDWEGRGHLFTPYQSQLNLMSFGEVDDLRMPPGKQASDVYGYLYPHIAAGCLEHGNLNIAKPDLEYRLWCYRAWIKATGLQGLYFDQTEPILGANPAAGCGYVLDLPDRSDLHGRIQPGYLLTNTRAFYKRLRAVFVEHGVNDPMIWIHDTDAAMISAFAFVGAFLDGENGPELTPEYPWFSQKYAPERMQAVTNPGKWGIGSAWLSMLGRSWNWPEARDKQYMAGRSLQGYARLHDFGDGWNYLSWKPFDRAKPMTFYPYWEPAVRAALKTDSPDVLAGAYRQDNRLQVLIFNRSQDRREGVRLRLDAAALGLAFVPGQTPAVTDLKGWECKGELPLDWKPEGPTGTLTLTIPPHDYRLLLVAPADPK